MKRPDENHLLIGGAWMKGEGAEVAVVDKYRFEPFATVKAASRHQVAAMMDAADMALRADILATADSAAILDRAAALVAARRRDLVAMLRREAGFTAADSQSEVDDCIQTLHAAAASVRPNRAETATHCGRRDEVPATISHVLAAHRVLAVLMPPNSPLVAPALSLAEALICRCPVILAPSPETPLTACALAEIMLAAGQPAASLSMLHGPSALTSNLASDPRVEVLNGPSLQKETPLADLLAFMILCDGADLDTALPKIMDSGYRRAGQTWKSVQILLVQANVLEAVQTRLARLVHGLKFGDPGKAETIVGPLISESEAIRVEISIEEAVAKGAMRLAGGPRRGAVVPPTLLKNVDAFMKLGRADIFGPVVCLEPFQTLEDAVRRVNAARCGLVTGLFTGNVDEALIVSEHLQLDEIYVGRADEPLLPGYGRSRVGPSARDPLYPIVH